MIQNKGLQNFTLECHNCKFFKFRGPIINQLNSKGKNYIHTKRFQGQERVVYKRHEIAGLIFFLNH